MLRSEEMKLITLYISKDTCRKTLVELGNLEMLHFKDMNEEDKDRKLLFMKENKYLEKLMSRVNFFKNSLEGYDLENVKINYDNKDIEVIEAEINKFYSRMMQLNTIKKETSARVIRLKEDHAMLEETENFVNSITEGQQLDNLEFITGIVSRSKKFLIKKVLHQALRRNIFLRIKDVENESKAIFIVFAHGGEAFDRVRKIFTSLGGRILDAQKYIEAKKGLLELTSVLSQVEAVEDNNNQSLDKETKKIYELYGTWYYFVNKEFRIYSTLNKFSFDEDRDCLVSEAWVRKDDLQMLKNKSESSEKGGWSFAFEPVEYKVETPPTYIKLNKYTECLQNLTNIYGVPKYGEINPAIFLLFLFPMLFGVMFGDVLHGLILMAISIYLIIKCDSLWSIKFLRMLLEGRYLMFLCSLAAIFFGLLYADFGSMPFSIASSRYGEEVPCFFGIDRIWRHSPNEVAFINSIKMKLSIIIGFFHMLLGVGISIFNCLHLNNMIDLYCIVIPQAIGFTAFLGYLVFLIFYKWLFLKDKPSIISVIVAMYTTPNNLEHKMFDGQIYVQYLILAIIGTCIPWMFFTKPILLISRNLVPRDNLLEVWIDSSIHTIEFGIGLISNTSSYLRLWAVSLAHSQLTEVLHLYTLGKLEATNMIFYIPLYILGTFFLLIGLEGMGSCLHSLRLNWIEFNSKYYKGDGYEFKPLNFKISFEEE